MPSGWPRRPRRTRQRCSSAPARRSSSAAAAPSARLRAAVCPRRAGGPALERPAERAQKRRVEVLVAGLPQPPRPAPPVDRALLEILGVQALRRRPAGLGSRLDRRADAPRLRGPPLEPPEIGEAVGARPDPVLLAF